MALQMSENRNGARLVHWGNIAAFVAFVLILAAVLPILLAQYLFDGGKTTAVLSLPVATAIIASTITHGLIRPVEKLPKTKD